jgi:hypothetical protein
VVPQDARNAQSSSYDAGLPSSLTDAICRHSARSIDKLRAPLSDGGGLCPEVSPNGSRWWFSTQRVGGPERRFALARYIKAE